jgi:hypothetical protein
MFTKTNPEDVVVMVETCKGNQSVTTHDWETLAGMIRENVTEEIKGDNLNLYGFCLVEVALAYVGYKSPTVQVRSERMLKVYKLAQTEPFLNGLMKHIHR